MHSKPLPSAADVFRAGEANQNAACIMCTGTEGGEWGRMRHADVLVLGCFAHTKQVPANGNQKTGD